MADGNVELAVSGIREAYAASMTPPSSPVVDGEQRRREMDYFLDGDGEMADLMKVVEANLVDVFAHCQCEETAPNEDDDNGRPPLVPSLVPRIVLDELPIHKPHAYPCGSTNQSLPALPSKWPQAPLMLRPSPRSQTKIRGIRYAGDREYRDYAGFCAGCILPINTGAEAPGKSLVIDFETKYFVGTLLMRIREAMPAEPEHQTSVSYFDGKKRRFQAIIKGRFKEEISMSRCVTGQMFDRPSGRLPAKWIVSSAIKFISTLSPQLEASIDGQQPKFLAPLAATAHSVIQHDVMMTNTKESGSGSQFCTEGKSEEEVDHLIQYSLYAGANDMEDAVEEPVAHSEHSIVPEVPDNSLSNSMKNVHHRHDMAGTTALPSVLSRQKVRKKVFHQVFAKQLDEPKFVTSKEYCFEFYQHLLLFGNDLAIDMGMPIGKISLCQALNGQPIKCMAGVKTRKHNTTMEGKDDNDQSILVEPLWSFDIWHQNLYPYAQKYYEKQEQ